MVDIDMEVIDICRQFLPDFHQGSFDDPRTEIVISDARKYLNGIKDFFDVAIIDLVEPLEESPARFLYTREFYQIVKESLKTNGIMSVQACASGWTEPENFLSIYSTLKSVFSVVRPYQVYIPSFVELWGFAIGSVKLDPVSLSPGEVDSRITQRLNKELKLLDGSGFPGLFILPKYLRERMATTASIVTDQNTLMTYSERDGISSSMPSSLDNH
jgi:spermidine synthase